LTLWKKKSIRRCGTKGILNHFAGRLDIAVVPMLAMVFLEVIEKLNAKRGK